MAIKIYLTKITIELIRKLSSISKLISLLALSTTTVLWAHNHTPDNVNDITELEGNARIFLKKDKINGMAEFKGRWQGKEHEFRYRSLTLGPYYRLFKNLKVGAFYRIQAGARHEDDWLDPHVGTAWFWRDTRRRTEHVFVGDITPRMQLDFLPGKNWVLELKNRYEYNGFNSQSTLIFRPGLTYFWFRDGAPFMNFFIQGEAWVPLNWHEDGLIWETWLYTGILYHVFSSFSAGLSVAYRRTQWSPSDSFKALFTTGYEDEGKESSFFFGLNLIYRIPL